MRTERIGYIDCIKAILIFLVVFSHTGIPSDTIIPKLNLTIMVNGLFFFISGIFFKYTSWKNFLKSRVSRLLIPFFFFYILSIPFRVTTHYLDNHEIVTFNWQGILDLFSVQSGSFYLWLNVPLWFLLTMFIVQLVGQCVFRFGKGAICVTICLSFMLKDVLESWPTVFMLNRGLAWYGYFALGYIVGPMLIKLNDTTTKLVICSTSALIVFITSYIIESEALLSWILSQVLIIQRVAFIVGVISIFSLFKPRHISPKISELINNLGQNTLALLCTHAFVLTAIHRAAESCVGIMGVNESMEVILVSGILQAILTILICLPLIQLLNRYFPIIVGNKPQKNLR